MSCLLSEDNVKAALEECKEPGTFKAEKFLSTSGINKLKPSDLLIIFKRLDSNGDECLDRDDIGAFLQKFKADFRQLTEQETSDFLSYGDPDQDGTIGVQEFQDMVAKSAK